LNCTAWHTNTIHDLAGTHSIHNLCKTVWTVCMSENTIGRHCPMCFSIRSPCNPTLMIKGMSGLVSNESAHTTDGEQRRLSFRSGRGLMNYLSEHGFTSHSSPPSINLHQARPRTPTRRNANPHDQAPCSRAAVYGTGNSPSFQRATGVSNDARVLSYHLQCVSHCSSAHFCAF
jgi:hypothetical protein